MGKRARAGTLQRARSRLYRSQNLQVSMRSKALAEIYTMHSFAQLCNLNFWGKNCYCFCQILQNSLQFSKGVAAAAGRRRRAQHRRVPLGGVRLPPRPRWRHRFASQGFLFYVFCIISESSFRRSPIFRGNIKTVSLYDIELGIFLIDIDFTDPKNVWNAEY